jgi:hypothetical protein
LGSEGDKTKQNLPLCAGVETGAMTESQEILLQRRHSSRTSLALPNLTAGPTMIPIILSCGISIDDLIY